MSSFLTSHLRLHCLRMSHFEKTVCILINFDTSLIGLNARKPVFGVCEKQRCRPACASVQSDQRLCYLCIGKYHIFTCYEGNFNFLASLCSGKTGLSLTLSETLKTGLVVTRPNLNNGVSKTGSRLKHKMSENRSTLDSCSFIFIQFISSSKLLSSDGNFCSQFGGMFYLNKILSDIRVSDWSLSRYMSGMLLTLLK